MKLFRIQNQTTGEGPFRSGSKHHINTYAIERYYSAVWHPIPHLDFTAVHDSIPFVWRFACDSIENLKKWFILSTDMLLESSYKGFTDDGSSIEEINRKFMNELILKGYSLAEIDIPDEFCQYGESLQQVRFDYMEISNIVEHPLYSFFEGHI